ncbi:MAG: ABC transporter permease [Candidatus Aminicenantes bacterium]|nr:ABC transporter permease [Candidatus Aminicenantes bacterium]
MISKKNPMPPRTARFLLRRLLPKSDRAYLTGDFDEIYCSIYADKGPRKAGLWYWFQLFQSLPKIISNSLYWSFVMFKNYLIVTLRNLRKHKGYSIINIAGLAVGMACFLLILLFVQYEFGYERHHTKADRIYRVNVEQHRPGGVFRAQSSPVPLAPTLYSELPEVVQFTRFLSNGNSLVSFEDKQFYESEVFFVDPGVLEMFDFPFVSGNSETALNDKNFAVITQDIGIKYFGREDPVGKSLVIDGDLSLTITGVIQNHPKSTNMNPQILISFKTVESLVPPSFFTNWISQQTESYILLSPQHSVQDLEEKIAGVFSKYQSSQDVRVLKLEQFKKMHLYSMVSGSKDIKTIYIFLAVGFLIILTACINFMNLSTARSASRAKEVGMRKVVGAARGQLIKQFIGETLIFSVISGVFALLLVYTFLPILNSLTGQFIQFADIGKTGILLGLFGIVLLVGILSGSYPALFLSGFKPALVLKGTLRSGKKGSLFRKVLVVAQFSISIFLIACTLIFGKQLHFMNNKDLGFKKDQILVLRNNSAELQRNIQPLRDALLQNPQITGVAQSYQLPSSIGMYNDVTWEGAQDEERIELMFNEIDYNFLDTYEIELLQGRNFSKEFPTDSRFARQEGRTREEAGSVLLNEEAVRRFGWENPVGKTVIQTYGETRLYFKVIGVIKNFHFSSLRNPIVPMNFFLGEGGLRYISVKIQTEDVSRILGYIEDTWKKIAPQSPFDSFFLDTTFERRYQSEERLQKLFMYFSVLAIFIGCLGLFGLASFAAEKRTKEIGIRKILGASDSLIIVLLSKEFTRLVLFSCAVALPMAYMAMHFWLKGYAYRININSHMFQFFGAGLAALVIAWITVSFQAVKAARSNPVDSLHYE